MVYEKEPSSTDFAFYVSNAGSSVCIILKLIRFANSNFFFVLSSAYQYLYVWRKY
jgi:hypothetical protein